MNKNRMILAVIGGVIGVAVLAMAYVTWSAYAAKTAAIEGNEESDGLETVCDKAQGLSRKPVYPCAASVDAINSNANVLVEWQAEAMKLACRGDKIFAPTTPAAFKTFIVNDARRLSQLPGLVNGTLMKPDFTFGPFKEYIAEGKMPAETQLAELQRKWDDVAGIVELLSGCGIAEVVGIDFKTAEAKEEEKADNGRNRANKKRKAAKAADECAKPPSAFSYVITFSARPAALVKAVNALETCERFTVVESFAFSRQKDAIAEALGADEKQEAQRANSRRGRRSRRNVEPKPEEAEGSVKGGIVTDPVLDAPFTVTMTVTVYDFRSLEDNEKKTEEEAK